MAHQQTNDFDALREVVEFAAETDPKASPLEIGVEETRRLDEQLLNIAKAQQEAGVAMRNVVLR